MPEQAQVEEEEIEITEEESGHESDEETISLAKSMGWVPEEEYRGRKENWVDAETFVDKGMNDLPILRERVKAQARKIGEMENDISEFRNFHEQTAHREYQKAMRDLQEKERKTVEDGDTETWEKLQREKATLSQQHAGVQNRQSNNPVFEQWKSESD